MREIKFRMWDGHAMQAVGTIKFHTDRSYHVNDEYPVNDATMREKFGGNRYHLMQFTGLKDKNGCDIYEGDVLAHNLPSGEHPYAVAWMMGDGFNGWYAVIENSNPKHFISLEAFPPCEVIGNICENPELLS